MKTESFVVRERKAQSAYFAKTHADAVGYEGSSYRLRPEFKCLNLAPSIRARAAAYFDAHRITWHRHVTPGPDRYAPRRLEIHREYGAPTTSKGDATRLARYEPIAFAPNGPIRNDVGLSVADFLWEPFYQLLRQQILACQMQKHHEDRAERVRVLHIAPAANKALLKITAPNLRNLGATTTFAALKLTLVDPSAFVSVATEEAFASLLNDPRASNWASYVEDRYTFLRRPTA